ncbi:MAG: trypsin-like peptidase domain-containing protein [Anaerolineae bacterium]
MNASSYFLRRGPVVVAAILLVAFGFVIGSTAMSTSASPNLLPSQQPVSAPINPILESERYFADIYSKVSPSVVSISVSGTTSSGQDFAAGGTGFVIDINGDIVTNDHVVDGASLIEVNFIDGTIVKGEVVGLDQDSDLAVIKVDLPSDYLKPVILGDSDKLFIGQSTLAIGSPFGRNWTLTSGIISALDRTISSQGDFSVGSVIQTDAAINPGNSGGPLLNLQGEVIGVNSQIASETRSNSGVGFAIPSNLVKRVAADLIAFGKVNYSYLGIRAGSEFNLALIEALKVPNNIRGVVISDVQAGAPAAQAGLRSASRPTTVEGQRVPTEADIITAIDNVPVTSMSGLISYLANKTQPGQTINLTVWRDGQQINIPVTLSERPT